MKILQILQTLFSRLTILVFNFALVIITTQIWGKEGRGAISIVIADLAIIAYATNVLSGSSVTYFAKKFPVAQVLSVAYIWSFFTGIFVAALLNLFVPAPVNFLYLVIASVLASLLSANINLFVGQQNMRWFNFFTVLHLVLQTVILLLLILVFKIKNVEQYFIAYILSTLFVFLITIFKSRFKAETFNFLLDKVSIKNMLKYGWNTQLSAFVHFFNQRLAFYILEVVKGLGSVGIYSVGIAISEAVWVVSRSVCMVLYSEIINNDDRESAVLKTKNSMKITFWGTMGVLLLILVIPSSLFGYIFGKDFSYIRNVIALLAPGILVLATSNAVGYFFAGINQLKILNIKSFVGLGVVLISLYIMVPRYGILGACVATSLSYIASSAVLFYKFYQITRFSFSDFMFSFKEFDKYLKKIKQ